MNQQQQQQQQQQNHCLRTNRSQSKGLNALYWYQIFPLGSAAIKAQTM